MSLVFRWFSFPIYCSIAGFANAGGQKHWTYVLFLGPILVHTIQYQRKVFRSPFIKLPDQFVKMKATEVSFYHYIYELLGIYVVESDL